MALGKATLKQTRILSQNRKAEKGMSVEYVANTPKDIKELSGAFMRIYGIDLKKEHMDLIGLYDFEILKSSK